jgi:hypothetical protein
LTLPFGPSVQDPPTDTDALAFDASGHRSAIETAKGNKQLPDLHVMWVIFVDISTSLEGLVVRDDGSLR